MNFAFITWANVHENGGWCSKIWVYLLALKVAGYTLEMRENLRRGKSKVCCKSKYTISQATDEG